MDLNKNHVRTDLKWRGLKVIFVFNLPISGNATYTGKKKVLELVNILKNVNSKQKKHNPLKY